MKSQGRISQEAESAEQKFEQEVKEKHSYCAGIIYFVNSFVAYQCEISSLSQEEKDSIVSEVISVIGCSCPEDNCSKATPFFRKLKQEKEWKNFINLADLVNILAKIPRLC